MDTLKINRGQAVDGIGKLYKTGVWQSGGTVLLRVIFHGKIVSRSLKQPIFMCSRYILPKGKTLELTSIC